MLETELQSLLQQALIGLEHHRNHHSNAPVRAPTHLLLRLLVGTASKDTYMFLCAENGPWYDSVAVDRELVALQRFASTAPLLTRVVQVTAKLADTAGINFFTLLDCILRSC